MGLDGESDDVRRRMAALRSHLEGDVENVTQSARAFAENARTMTNWRYVIRSFPFAAAGAALAIGYLIVPRRPQVIVPDPETLAQMAKANQVYVKTGSPKSQEKERGMLGGLVAIAASTAGRFALNWATAQVKSSIAAAAANHPKAAAEETEEADEPISQTSKFPPR